MTTVVKLRSRVMGNYQARFWRAVEGATPSLTLIIRDEGLRILTSGTGDSAYCLAVRQGSKGRKSSTVLQATG